MGARLRLTLVILTALAWLPPRADACSCLRPDEGFVVPSGAVLPSNAAGFAWWGDVLVTDKNDEVKRALPPKALFRIQQLGPGGPKDVAFDLQFTPERFADLHQRSWGRALVILKPRRPLTSGAKYRLTFRVRRFFREQPSPSGRSQSVDVSVSADPLAADTKASLVVGAPIVAAVEVTGLGGLCSAPISAAQLPLIFGLPPAAEQWRRALLYTVTVDGTKQWQPTHSNCSDIPHGSSWVGLGKELLYVNCSTERVAQSLTPGAHLVTMRAWLPGTDLFLTAERRVSLACQGAR